MTCLLEYNDLLYNFHSFKCLGMEIGPMSRAPATFRRRREEEKTEQGHWSENRGT